MNFGSSAKVDVGGSVKGAADAAAKAKADVSGGLKGAAGAAAGVKADVSGKVSGAVSGAKDAAGAVKDKATGAIESVKDAAADAASAVKAKANAAVDAAKEKAAQMQAECKAAVDKFKGSVVAPANGWKAGFAAAGSITIGKSFSMGSGITLGGNDKFVESEGLTVIFNIDPNTVESQDDTFILYSNDKAETFRQEKTVRDDLIEKDDKLTLKFEGLAEDLSYNLMIDPGEEGEPYLLFEDRPYGDWFYKTDNGTFKIVFDIDPESTECKDDTFTLYSTDDEKTYEQVKTVQDDLKKGDSSIELKFEELDRRLNYSLEVNPGKEGEPYFIFENLPYSMWGGKSE